MVESESKMRTPTGSQKGRRLRREVPGQDRSDGPVHALQHRRRRHSDRGGVAVMSPDKRLVVRRCTAVSLRLVWCRVGISYTPSRIFFFGGSLANDDPAVHSCPDDSAAPSCPSCDSARSRRCTSERSECFTAHAIATRGGVESPEIELDPLNVQADPIWDSLGSQGDSHGEYSVRIAVEGGVLAMGRWVNTWGKYGLR